MSDFIVFNHVKKAYGAQSALCGLNLSLEKGKVTALLGPNGAGKTTAVSIMLGLIKATSGTVTINGLAAGHKQLKEMLGAMLQDSPIMDGLTVRETISLTRQYYKKPLSIDRLLQISGLEKEASKRASTLSGGQRRRLAFAVALAGDPDVIVLDEPTVGMDVDSRVRFWEVIRTFAHSGKTILLTTHYLEEADTIADRIVVIAQGELIAEGTPEQLKSSMPLRRITFKAGIVPDLQQLEQLSGVNDVHLNGNQVTLTTADSDLLLQQLLRSSWQISDITVQTASLEAVFQQITQAYYRNEAKESE